MRLRTAVFLAACLFSAQAPAQAFRAKPLKIVVGYPPGGSGDFLTRVAADEMSKDLAKPEVREKIAVQGMDATPSPSPEAFEADIRAEGPVIQRLVRDSGAKVE